MHIHGTAIHNFTIKKYIFMQKLDESVNFSQNFLYLRCVDRPEKGKSGSKQAGQGRKCPGKGEKKGLQEGETELV
jgi:hypothetical protein